MRIKKLEIHGFKSFKDRTVIHFDAGITGIVGPNGCGKSNIVDALVWVMGEMSAKHLRGGSMSDVIFAGADGYAPVGMAEVSLTLENDGGPFPAKYLRHAEIMVTRRLHRSGESEYLINKEPARLRDIQEVFMDTGAGSKGFSIVEQGAIGRIVTAKPEDRRSLIEEAAGITKFKVRKRESQRKLTSTEQNLVRLQDIIGEQKRQLDSLQRQAQRAERYRNLKTEIEDKELWFNSREYLNIHVETEEAQRCFDLASEGEASSAAQVEQMRSDLEKFKLETTELEAHVDQKQRAQQESQARVQEKEHEIRELEFEIEQAKRNKEMTGSIVDQHQARKTALDREYEETTTKLQKTTEQSESSSSEYEKRNEEYQLVSARVNQIDEELTEKRRSMLALASTETHLEARITSLNSQKEDSERRLASAQDVLQELMDKKEEITQHRQKVYQSLEGERQMQLDIMKDVDHFDENLQHLSSQLTERKADVELLKDDLKDVSGRLYGLENLQDNFEGFQEGVKNVMLWQRKKNEVHADGSVSEGPTLYQPLSEVVEVPQEYELAMEVGLGHRLQLLLSQDQQTSLEAVDYLKESQSGRGSFVSKDVSGDAELDEASLGALKQQEGVKSFLSDVVSVPDQYHQQVAYFLKDIVIVDSIRTALRLRSSYKGYQFVTLDGDMLSADGVLTGGAAESGNSGLIQRKREIKELSLRREELSGKLALSQATIQKMEEQAESLKKSLEEARQKHNEKEIQVVELKKDLERADNEFETAEYTCKKQDKEVEEVAEQVKSYEQNLQDSKVKLQETLQQKTELEAQVNQLDEELSEHKDGIEDLQNTVMQLKVDSARLEQEVQGLRTQKSRVEESLSEVESHLRDMSEQKEKSQESLSTNSVRIEESRVQLEKFISESEESQKRLSQAKDEYEQKATQSRELEEKVHALQTEVNEQKSSINENQLKLEQLKMKEQYLLDQMLEKYQVNLAEVALRYKDDERDFAATKKEVEDLKSKIKRIGEVNLSAIQEYDELVERYEFMAKQYDELLDAKDQLRKVIDRINRICTKRFRETFDQVNERFVKVFPVLFGGGEARLVLVEDPDKDEVGIDIISRPPGKKMQNVSLMSGGEKALTAVSLIFSIFLVKPSPFCLLDEVDAPLDDANVFRFNDLVREMAKRSQIIVVTHNKHTMKVNNKIFGVTMEEKGVSKMVSVSLAQAEKVVG